MSSMNPLVRLLVLSAILGWSGFALADDAAKSAAAKPEEKTADKGPKKPDFDDVVKDAKHVTGLLNVYQKGTKLLAEIPAGHLNKDFIVLISIAKGIGQQPLLGGMTWGFGDDWIWQFRKVDDRILIVRKNVRFTAAKGSPEEKAVDLAYTDSVLFSLPILTQSKSNADVVDLTQVFMSDLPQISLMLPGFAFSESKSQWAAVKGFKDNLELEVAATYASGGMLDIDSVADSRGATINVHYSISLLPQGGYQPRLADDRVGYFLTVLKDYSRKTNDDRFVRYINRWDLRKADPAAEMSPPAKPIIFWLEKTIPYAYRKPIRDGILEWNKAFEKAGFVNAIEVRQQPDNADWDPEDINYNTFRWITSSAGFAMGPSRTNPMTGQILDADIIFDSDFLTFWKEEYETFTPESIARMTGGPLDLKSYQELARKKGLAGVRFEHACCELHSGLSREFAFGASMLAARTSTPAERDKLILQGLKEVTMHEVGHTLGLRHNFKASTFLTIEEMSDVSKTAQTGLTASVMDYAPANIVPDNAIQGDFFSQTIGPYDMWAIEYGYKPFTGGTEGEVAELKKIAARSGEPGHAFATDEDTRGIDPDPLTNRFDLGKDPVAYAKQRATMITELLPKAIDEAVKDGDGYEKARRVFGILLGNYGTAMYFSARNIGGLYVNRSHKADANGQPPFVVVDAAKQRDALTLLEQNVFNDKPFNFPPDLYNRLAASRWNHWGTESPLRPDYPVHAVIEMWQARILEQLLSPLTLERLHDSELKVAADQDAFTLAELISRLTSSIFSEVNKLPEGEFTNRKPAISSLRRNLQRHYLKRLGTIALGQTAAPEDCQTIAYAELVALQGKMDTALKANPKLDSYSKAHLEESKARIQKITDARLTAFVP
jgi:hypothetical protein